MSDRTTWPTDVEIVKEIYGVVPALAESAAFAVARAILALFPSPEALAERERERDVARAALRERTREQVPMTRGGGVVLRCCESWLDEGHKPGCEVSRALGEG